MSAGAAVAAAEARRATAAKEKRKRDLEARREKDREAKEAGLQATDIYSGAKALVAKARAEKERLERVKLNLPEKDQIFGLEGLVREPPTDRVKGPSGRLYANASLWCMQVHHQPRKAAIYMVESSWFDPLILVTILANCFTMAWESPMDPTGTVKEAFIDVCEWIYLWIFTFELMSKVIAYGFLLHEGSYLRDAWCQLDFVVVSLAWLPIIFPSFGNMSAIRSVRAFRPLRALKRVPGMPVLVGSILSAMPKLGNVLALCGFIFLVFGIVGMELFKGSLHYRCAEPGFEETAGHPVNARRLEMLIDATPALLGPNATRDAQLAATLAAAGGAAVATAGGDLLSTAREALAGAAARARRVLKGGGATVAGSGGTHSQADFDSGVPCDPSGIAGQCEAGQTCAYFDTNPFYGLTSFDSVPLAFISILQAITFDTWTPVMYSLMASFAPAASVFFMAIVILGGFFVVNLFLAVIFQEFMSAQAVDDAVESELTRLPDADLESPLAVVAFQQGGSYAEAIEVQDSKRSDGKAPLLQGGTLASDGTLNGGGGKRSCCDCAPDPKSWRTSLARVVTGDVFGNGSTALVLLNMALMCMPYEGNSEEYAARLELGASVITWMFIIEMGLKLIGLGCTNYWVDGWNQLDGSIVIMSIVEMILTWIFAGGGMNLSFLRILRMLRVLRMLKLMKSWKGLYKIVMTFGKAIPQMSNLFVLMFLILFIFALLGMQMFGAAYTADKGFSELPCPGGECPGGLAELPRYHFDYFMPAMLSTFVLMTGGWIDAMGPATVVAGPLIAGIYFVVVVVVGCYIVMNLFVAILLNAFADDDDDASSAGGSASGRSRRSSQASSVVLLPDRSDDGPTSWPEDYACCCFGPRSRLRHGCEWISTHQTFDTFIVLVIVVSSICLGLDSPRLPPTSDLAFVLKQLDYAWTAIFTFELSVKVIARGFAFGKHAYIKSGWNLLDLLIVVVSYLVLLAEIFPPFKQLKTLRVLRVLRPLRLVSRNPGMKLVMTSLIKALPAVTNVFGVVLAMMLVFAILGMQLFMGTLASCTDPTIRTREECVAPPPSPPGWHSRALLGEPSADDFGLASPPPAFLAAASFANATGQLVAGAVAASAVERLAAWQAGSEQGQPQPQQPQLQQPQPQPQQPPPRVPLREQLARRASRRLKGGGGGGGGGGPVGAIAWVNPDIGSFDDFGGAMLLLYIMSTGDEWDTLMFATMDSTTSGHAPERNDVGGASMFSIAWMFIGSFFAMNLFVGVIVDNFNRIKAESDGSATMTPEQQQWVSTMQARSSQQAARMQRPPQNSAFRLLLYKLVTSNVFDGIITAVIIANVGVMACDYWGIEQDLHDVTLYNTAMLSFSYIYYVEATLKIIGFGPLGYFSDNWCRFDFFLVSTSLLDQFAAELLAQVLPLPPMLLRVLRVFRILRILRLLKSAKELKNLIVTMILSFPPLINVGSILALLIFMFAVLGINLFTFVARGENLDAGRNFETLGNAMLVLFQCLTGDGWAGMMSDAMVQEESGRCSEAAGDCGSASSIPYFVAFQILGSFVFLNLVVAVILENFSSLGNLNPELVSSSDIEIFKDAWAVFDPDADQMMSVADLPKLVMACPPPLGLRGEGDEKAALRKCLKLKLRQENGQVAFTEVLDAMIHHNFKSTVDDDTFDENELVQQATVPKSPSMRRSSTFESLGSPARRAVGSLSGASHQALIEKRLALSTDVAAIFALKILRKRVVAMRDYRAAVESSPSPGGYKGRSSRSSSRCSSPELGSAEVSPNRSPEATRAREDRMIARAQERAAATATGGGGSPLRVVIDEGGSPPAGGAVRDGNGKPEARQRSPKSAATPSPSRSGGSPNPYPAAPGQQRAATAAAELRAEFRAMRSQQAALRGSGASSPFTASKAGLAAGGALVHPALSPTPAKPKSTPAASHARGATPSTAATAASPASERRSLVDEYRMLRQQKEQASPPCSKKVTKFAAVEAFEK